MEHTNKAVEEEVSAPNLERQQPPRYSLSAITGLFATQFLGAFNDNFYKIVVSLFAVNAVGSAGGGGSALSLMLRRVRRRCLQQAYRAHRDQIFRDRGDGSRVHRFAVGSVHADACGSLSLGPPSDVL